MNYITTSDGSTIYIEFIGFDEWTMEMKEYNTLVVSDMNRLADEIQTRQETNAFLSMLICGLLGVIIGVCLVNIFKSR